MTKQKIIFITIVSICSFFIYFESCKKKATLVTPPPCTLNMFPEIYNFEINKGEQFVTDKSLLSQIRVSYYDANKTKQYLQENIDISVSDTFTVNGTIHRTIGGRSFGFVSGDTVNGSKTFYVEYPAQLGTVDTLYIDYTEIPCGWVFDTTTINHQQLPKNIYIMPAAKGATETVPYAAFVIYK